ncbi:MAG: hypothetical protein U0270_39495 [Labilithrix sp.]
MRPPTRSGPPESPESAIAVPKVTSICAGPIDLTIDVPDRRPL